MTMLLRGLVGFVLAACMLFGSVLSSPTPNQLAYRVKESLHSHPPRWRKVAPAPPDHMLHMRIGLKQNNIGSLINRLYQVSDPDHYDYGNHLSLEQVKEYITPSSNSIKLVQDWLSDHTIDPTMTKLSTAKDWIEAMVPVSMAEKLLGTEYHIYQHEDNDHHTTVRSVSYSLPDYLHDHIDVVVPTTYFSNPQPMRKPILTDDNIAISNIGGAGSNANNLVDMPLPTSDPSNQTYVTAEQLGKYYKTIDYIPKATDKNKLAILGYLGEVALRDDLQLYLNDQRKDVIGADFEDISVSGGTNNQTLNKTQIEAGTGKEANLDIQTAFGIAYPTPIQYISIAGRAPFQPDLLTPTNTNEPYLDLVEYLMSLSDDELPQTISTSYDDSELTVPYSYAKRVCDGFAQLGARGVTFLYASGDFGVGPDGPNAYQCQSNDGKNTTMFLPQFPSTCPHVTSVGATQNFDPEIAVTDTKYDDYYSGGGFSKYFDRPEYQKEAVQKYLDKHQNDFDQDGLFNAKGRGFPDVAAQGLYFRIMYAGNVTAISGTSASTPLFSSIVSLLNDHLISNDKKPLGFMNPFLYKKGYQGLMDITQGASKGCNTTGFLADDGWDPVTGLGTPDFKKLIKLIDDDDDDDDDDEKDKQ